MNLATEIFIAKTPLPAGWDWYRVGSQVLFPMGGFSGGGSTRLWACLVKEWPTAEYVDLGREQQGLQISPKGYGGQWIVIEFDQSFTLEQAQVKIERVVNLIDLQAFQVELPKAIGSG